VQLGDQEAAHYLFQLNKLEQESRQPDSRKQIGFLALQRDDNAPKPVKAKPSAFPAVE